jgi:NTE family protein
MIETDEIKIGLTLSGGGVRASVFHLGVFKKLAEEGMLDKIKMLSTVSGGTLVTGLIYHTNNYRWPTSEELTTKCIPEIKRLLTKRNLQLNAILRTIFWPFPYFGKGRASIVSSSIKYCWGIKTKLNTIAEENPRWNINATTMESGKSWRFIPNKRMGDYVLNYVSKPDIDLSLAMCCSAAVPYLIGPLKLKTKNYTWFEFDKQQKEVPYKQTIKKLNIWDGGAYDNLGIEALVKFNNGAIYRDEINYLVVSDAAMGITTRDRKLVDPMRLIDVTMDQVRALRARVLMDHFKNTNNSGIYLRIGDDLNYIRKALGKTDNINSSLTADRIKQLKNYPTTLWKMKEKDFDELMHHGWEIASASINK